MIRGKPIYYLFGIIIVVAMILTIRRKGGDNPVLSVPATGRQTASGADKSSQGTASIPAKLPSISTQQTAYASFNASRVQPDEESKNTRTNLVRVAGQKFPLLFETSGLSDALKDAISNDIELNLSHFEHITLRDISGELKDPSQISHLTATHLLDEGRQVRLFPEAFEKYFGGVILSNGVSRIVVRDELIKAYERALDYIAQHPVMFSRLDEFLTRLRSEQFLKTIESDPETAQNTFFFDRAPSEGVEYAQQLSGFLKNATIRDPSILDFSSQTYGEKEGIRCITLITWPKGMSSEPVMKGFPQFVYVDEKWRIYVPRSP